MLKPADNPPPPQGPLSRAEIIRCLRSQASAHYAQTEFGLTLAHPELLLQAADVLAGE